MPKDVCGFAEHQGKATYGLGDKLTLARSRDEANLDKAAGNADARFKNSHIHWYIPHYIHPIQQQGNLSKQTLSKTPTELR